MTNEHATTERNVKQTSEDETALIEAMIRGESAAYHQAVRRYSAIMRRTAAAIAGQAAADDIIQEAWISVVRNIGDFQGRSTLRTWLVAIVANRARTLLRSRQREQLHRETPGENDSVEELFDRQGRWRSPVSEWGTDVPDNLLQSDELRECLEKHMAALPEKQRDILVARDVSGLDQEAICNTLDVSSSNARVLLHRARMALFRMIETFRETGRC